MRSCTSPPQDFEPSAQRVRKKKASYKNNDNGTAQQAVAAVLTDCCCAVLSQVGWQTCVVWLHTTTGTVSVCGPAADWHASAGPRPASSTQQTVRAAGMTRQGWLRACLPHKPCVCALRLCESAVCWRQLVCRNQVRL
jgi:hypothetical protein